MVGRPTDEEHRSATVLELFFDLCFVVAVAQAASALHDEVAEDHVGDGVVGYAMVFFAIWWAWMNFTWFASSYDTDDVPYRLLTMLQMGGVLVLAAGVPVAFAEDDFRAVTLGYLVMRIGLVAQWVRAGVEHPAGRATAFRYAMGISVVQALWLLRLGLAGSAVLPTASLVPVFAGLAVLELAVPPWAERKRPTSWHPHHIAERYGLFTIILLGESVLAASTGVQSAFEAGGLGSAFVSIAVGGLVLLFALWWLYFLEPSASGLTDYRDGSYLWGYGHYGIFAALAAVGGGLEVAVEQTGHHLAVSGLVVGYAVAVPVGVFLVLLWAVHTPIVPDPVIRPGVILAAAVVVLLLPLAAPRTGLAAVVVAIAVVVALVIVATLTRPSVGARA